MQPYDTAVVAPGLRQALRWISIVRVKNTNRAKLRAIKPAVF